MQDRLLEEDDIDIGQVSGTSAGALNGAALASGLARGGRAGAKEHFSLLWHGIAAVGTPLAWLMTSLRKPRMGVWDDALPLLSPCITTPLAMEPVRALLAGVGDVDAKNAAGLNALYVNAVNVNAGRCRVFGSGEQSLQTILALACAPLVFHAIVLTGSPTGIAATPETHRCSRYTGRRHRPTSFRSNLRRWNARKR